MIKVSDSLVITIRNFYLWATGRWTYICLYWFMVYGYWFMVAIRGGVG
jgi:hypothetical protein